MSDKERVKAAVNWILEQRIVANRGDLAELMGYNRSSLSQIESENGSKKVTESFIDKLCKVDDRLSKQWLLNGVGEMLVDRVVIEKMDTQINKSNARQIMINALNVTVAPLISQFAQAGYLSGYADTEFLDNQPLYVASRKHSGGNYIAFEVRGDSMFDGSYKSICSGDVILGRELYRYHWTSKLHVPKVFIIVHKEDGILCKEITDHDVEKGIITCRSFNPDKQRYPDFTMSLEDIQQLFYMKELQRGNDY